jgi:hypothetical protein
MENIKEVELLSKKIRRVRARRRSPLDTLQQLGNGQGLEITLTVKSTFRVKELKLDVWVAKSKYR